MKRGEENLSPQQLKWNREERMLKKQYTSSPLDDPEIREQVKNTATEEYGNTITDEIFSTKNMDVEVDMKEDSFVVDAGSKAELDVDVFMNLLKDTEHLELYDELNITLGLDGEAYTPCKKMIWYYENSIKQPVYDYHINNKTHVDNRGHMLVIGEASAGKSTIKSHVKKITDDEDYHEVSGLSHEKQLAGTQITKGRGENKTTEIVPGLLSYKVLVNDETQDMINELNEMYAHSQRLKRIAMDTYGDNDIFDKLVKTEKENRLRYNPPVRVLDLAHPKKFSSQFFDNGSFRRYGTITILQPDRKINLNSVTDFKFDKRVDLNFKDLLDDYYSKKRKEVKFDDKTMLIISNFHKAILFYLLKHKNQNAFRYGLLTRYSLRGMFCKNVLILAMSRNESVPGIKTTTQACYDTLYFILETLKSINQLGNMGVSSDAWGGVNEQDAQALEYLYRTGNTSFEKSRMSINRFWTILGHLYGCKLTQARQHYYRLKRDNFIDSKQNGSYGSVVWLKFRPKEIEIDAEGYDPFGVWEPLIPQGVGTKKALLTPLKVEDIDDKILKACQGDSGVGVLGCVLFKKYICVQVEELFLFSSSITQGGQKPTPMTPSHKEKLTATIKHPKQGVKTPKLKPTPSNTKNNPLHVQPVLPDQPKSDRDTQYWEDPITSDITPCNKEEVLKYIKQNKSHTLPELLVKFGPGVMVLKKEGLIK